MAPRKHPVGTCSRCGETDPAAFYPSALKGGGWCRVCQRAYYRKKVEENPDYFVRYQRETRKRNADVILQLKMDRGCAECGEKHPACLDLHHADESTKEFAVSHGQRANKTLPRLLAEAEKCVVLCSNCHRKRHYTEKSGHYRPKRPDTSQAG